MKISKRNVEDILALSPMQEGMLYHRLRDPESDSYFEQITLVFREPLDEGAFCLAWKDVVSSNNALRTTFRWNKIDHPVQVILKEHDPDIMVKHSNDLESVKIADRRQNFNLETVPLRVTLVKMHKKDAILISYHHILFDGWSLNVVIRELFDFYWRRLSGQPIVVQQKPSFKKYIQYIQGSDKAVQEAYWSAYLEGLETSNVQGFSNSEGAGVQKADYVVVPDDFERIMAFCRLHGVTFATLLYCAWGMLLQRYTGSRDVIFGTTVSGRGVPIDGIDQSVGLFINTLPFRINTKGNDTVWHLLAVISGNLAERQDVFMSSLSDIKSWCKLPSYEELLDSIVVIENYPIDNLVESAARVESHSMYEATNYNLTLTALPDEALRLTLQFNEQRFSRPFVEAMLRHVHALLIGIISSDRLTKVSSVEMLTSLDREVLEGFRTVGNNASVDATLSRALYDSMLKHEEEEALVWEGGSLTFGDLRAKASKLAGVLRGRGIERNSVVGLMVERSPEMVIGALAILLSGGAYLPLDPDLPEERLRYILEDSGVGYILGQHKFLSDSSCGFPVIAIDDERVWDVPTYTLELANEPQDLAYIMYTSGSTGRPKGVMIEQHSVVNRLQWMQRHYPIGPGDTILQKTSYTFDVSVWELFWWILSGARVAILPPGQEKDPGAIIEAIGTHGVTTIHFVPSLLGPFLTHLEIHRLGGKISSTLRHVFCSGEALLAKEVRRWYEVVPHWGGKLINLYGPTEATVDVTHFTCEPDPSGEYVPIGKPVDNTSILIVDQDRNLQPVGVPGELYIAGGQVARGYLNRPQLNQSSFVDLPYLPGERMYRTGDRARWLDTGDLEFLGRFDDQIKIRGRRVELGEIRSTLCQHEWVKDAVVLADISDAGVQVRAFIMADRDMSMVELRQFLEARLPDYMIPAHFNVVPVIPLTTSGKVDRKRLLAMERYGIGAEKITQPRPGLQQEVANEFAAMMGIARVGSDTNFFNNGGDSIRAIRLVSALNSRFQTALSLSDLYENPTVEQMADAITTAKTRPVKVLDNNIERELSDLQQRVLSVVDRPEDIQDVYPLSAIQRGMMFHFLRDRRVYYEQFVFTMHHDTPFDIRRMYSVWQWLAERHDVLRTCFYMEEFETPVALVFKSKTQDIQSVDLSDLSLKQRIDSIQEVLREDLNQTFDLEKHPLLWKVRIFKVGERDTIMAFVCHHAILDGWSLNHLMTEMQDLYRQLEHGPAPRLAPLGITYKAVVTEELRETRDPNNVLFWRNELAEFERLDFVVKTSADGRGARERVTKVYQMGSEIFSELEIVAQRCNTTVKEICFAGYVYVLGLLSYQTDMVVGYVTNTRPVHHDGDRILGCFLNTIPVRLQIPSETTWEEYLHAVHSKLLELKRYERVPLYEIANIVGESRGSTNPIVDTLFNYMEFDFPMDRMLVETQIVEGHQDTNTLFDFMIDGTMGNMKLTLRYDNTIFGPGVDDRISGYFHRFLRQLIDCPGSPVESTVILSGEELYQVLYEFSPTTTSPDEFERLVHQLFEDRVVEQPNSLALDDGNQQLSYRELNARANRLAHILRKNGIGPNARVGILLGRTSDMVVSTMAVLKAGGAYVPVDPSWPEARVRKIFRSAKIKGLITDGKPVGDSLFDGVTASVTAAVDESLPDCNLSVVNVPSDLAYTIFTSGSTGEPSGVDVEHRSVTNLIYWVNESFHIGADDKMLFVTALSFDLSVYDIFGILAAGGSIRLATTREIAEPEELAAVCANENITFWDSTPQALARVLPFVRNYSASPPLRWVFLSGDWVPVGLPTQIQDLFRTATVVVLGGATEATVWSNFFVVGTVGKGWSSIPYGKPIQNAKYYVMNANLKPCPIGVRGDLYIGGDVLARGYTDPQKTHERFVSSPYCENARLFKTGDQARWFTDGNLEFLGRSDDQVKIRGFRVELKEIEKSLIETGHVVDAVVVARGDRTARYLVAFVVPDNALDANELRHDLSKVLPHYMIPEFFVQLDALPTTSNGKVDKRGLDKLSVKGRQQDRLYAPKNAVEERIIGLWREVLSYDGNIDDSTNYFEIGGNSLNAATCVARTRQIFDVEFSLQEFFEESTPGGLTRAIERHMEDAIVGRAAHDGPSIVPVSGNRHPLSSAQKRIFIMNELQPHSTYYNATIAVQIDGEIDYLRCETVLRTLVQRHASLRTRFLYDHDSLVQEIVDPAEISIGLEVIQAEGADTARLKVILGEFTRPFDLSRAPLFRTALIRRAADSHVLVLDLHHIISDGTSMAVFMKDFWSLYDENDLPLLPVQYKDYVHWHNNLLLTEDLLRQENFWLETFRDGVPILDLVPAEERPQVVSTFGDRVGFSVDGDVAEKLRELSLLAHGSLFVVLLAAFKVLLARMTGQNEFVVGTAVANRNHEALKDQIGVFINMVPLYGRLRPGMTFVEVLEDTSNTAFKALGNQDYPFDSLVERLGIPRDPSRHPMFDVMFLYQTDYSIDLHCKSLAVRPYQVQSKTAKVDLSLEAWSRDGAIYFNLEYATGLFRRETIDKLVETFVKLLGDVVMRPDECAVPCPRTAELQSQEIVFTEHEVDAFAGISHDFNPLHVNETYARQTPFGARIVHGVLACLTVLRKHLTVADNEMLQLYRVVARFNGPLYPGRVYRSSVVELTGSSAQFNVAETSDPLLELSVEYGVVERPKGVETGAPAPVGETALDPIKDFDEVNLSGPYSVDPTGKLNTLLSNAQWASMLWMSYFVGMIAPGRQALFTGFEIEFAASLPERAQTSLDLQYSAKTSSYDRDLGALTCVGSLVIDDTIVATATMDSFVRPMLSGLTLDEIMSDQRIAEGSRLDGTVAVVTGASRGLGAGIAKMLAARGATVALSYLDNHQRAREVLDEIVAAGGSAILIPGDITHQENCDRLVTETLSQFGKVDILVNNAFQVPVRQEWASLTLDEFQRFVDVAVTMTFNLAHTFLPSLESSDGTMITISSDFVCNPPRGFSHYVAAKAAVEGLVKALAEEYPGVTHAIVRPKTFLSDMTLSNVTAKYLDLPLDVIADVSSGLTSPMESNFGIWTGTREESMHEAPDVQQVGILSSYTVDGMVAPLRWWMDKFGLDIPIRVAPYGQVFQQLLDKESSFSRNTGIEVVLIRFEDWIRDSVLDDDAKRELLLKTYNELTNIVGQKAIRARLLVGLHPISTDNRFSPAIQQTLGELTQQWKRFVLTRPSAHLIDLTRTAADYLVGEVFSPKTDADGHVPFTEEYEAAVATEMARKIIALTTPNFKVVVVDCDNTLWRGVCGEDGALGIGLDHPYLHLQRFLLERHRDGLVLALVSKNNENDVRAVFENNPNMILTMDHFSAWRINWKSKSDNIRDLAAELNLGLDSFIFLDDNIAEVYEVMQKLPQVLSLRLPEAPDDIPVFLRRIWAFDRGSVTDEDRRRGMFYAAEQKRSALKASLPSVEDYLQSLDIQVKMRPLGHADLQRASQLTFRTNQFNLSTIRRTPEQLLRYLSEPGALGWIVEVSDVYGDYGVVGTLLATEDQELLCMDTFLLSCRVLGRGVEQRVLARLLLHCKDRGLKGIRANFYPSAKNEPFRVFLSRGPWKEVSHTPELSIYDAFPSDIDTLTAASMESEGPGSKREPVGSQTRATPRASLPEPEDAMARPRVVFDHIGVAVKDPEDALARYRSWGYVCGPVVDEESQDSLLALCTKPGSHNIELVFAPRATSPTSRFIARHGDNTPYHLCYRVSNVQTLLATLQVSFQEVTKLTATRIFGGKRVMFIYIDNVGLVELLEDPEIGDEVAVGPSTMIRWLVPEISAAVEFFQSLGYVMDRNHSDVNELRLVHSQCGALEIYSASEKAEPGIRTDWSGQPELFLLSGFTEHMTSWLGGWSIPLVNEEALLHRPYWLPLEYPTGKRLNEIRWGFHNNMAPVNSRTQGGTAGHSSHLEGILLSIWREYLIRAGINALAIDVDDDFFRIGGNSLILLQVNRRLQEVLGIEIPFVKLFQYPTIKSLAAFLSEEEPSEPRDFSVRMQTADKGKRTLQQVAKFRTQRRG